MNCPHCNHPLSIEEARSIRGALNATERTTRSGGKQPSCTCGVCRKCKQRDYKRKARSGETK